MIACEMHCVPAENKRKERQEPKIYLVRLFLRLDVNFFFLASVRQSSFGSKNLNFSVSPLQFFFQKS